MSLFDWLLVGHLVGDFLLQTDDMARYKVRSWSWMFRHIGFYMLVMTVVVGVYALRRSVPPWVVFVLLVSVSATHIFLDRREFTLGWMRLAGMSSDHPWLPIVVDQVFHILVLVVVAQVLILTGR